VRQSTHALVLPCPSANPSVTSDRRALWNVCHPLVNALVYTSIIMAGLSVIVAKYRNCFATLCEIPKGIRPPVYLSVIMAKCHNLFATLCEIPTGISPLVKLAIFLQVLFVLRVYPPAQKLELQTYSTHNTITRADNYKINISCPQLNCYQLNRTLQCGYHLLHQHSLVH